MKQAMIFAAGMGTRLKPLTDTMPKALVPIAGTPLLAHVILKLKQAGFEKIVVNVHHFSEMIIDYLKSNQHFGIEILISDESEKLLETGGGIKKAAHFFDINSPVLIHNVDIISNIDLNELLSEFDNTKTDAILAVSQRDTFRYFLFDDKLNLKGWINEKTGETKPKPNLNSKDFSKLAFSGIHLISGTLIAQMLDYPDKFPITDFYLEQCNNFTIKAFIPENLKLLDVGKIDIIEDAENFLKSF